MTISVAFVDDHPTFLDGLSAIFAEDGAYSVVAKGNCAEDAVSIAETKTPAVLVIDLNMPGNAFDAIARISKRNPTTKLLAFTASARVEHAVAALKAGARGYILKGSTAAELFEAVRSVAAGGTFITPSFASQVISSLHSNSARDTPGRLLSARETQLIKLLMQGQSNREIGESLNISEKTVKHYMTILMQKMQVRSRLEVVLAAQRVDPGKFGFGKDGSHFPN